MKFLKILFYGILIEGFIAKSFFFVGNDPVAAHYVASILLLTPLIIFYLIQPFSKERINFGVIFLFLILLTAFIASFLKANQSELIAFVSFFYMIIGFVYCIPYFFRVYRIEGWRLIMQILIFILLSSLALLLVNPAAANDPTSDRFSGSLISVAVACNIFFYAAVLTAVAAKFATTKRQFYVYALLCMLSIVFLYLTKTKSSLAEAMICVTFVILFNKKGVIDRKHLILASYTFISGVVLFLLMSDTLNIERLLAEFRIIDGSITTSRNKNWESGLARIQEAPLFGDGLLAKHTRGGSESFSVGNNYDAGFDPHSLPLSLGTQAGIPFMLLMMLFLLYILLKYLSTVGLRVAVQRPEFLIGTVHLIVMIFAGGDLTSLGNLVYRLYWLFIGILALQTLDLQRKKTKPNIIRQRRMPITFIKNPVVN